MVLFRLWISLKILIPRIKSPEFFVCFLNFQISNATTLPHITQHILPISVGRFRSIPLGRRSIVLPFQQRNVADKMDGPRVDKFPTFYHSQRCVDVRCVCLGNSDGRRQTIPGRQEQ